ncbi:MAG TPA: GntR family transcriptional regulator [Stellaceae bacterium]|nr:GntR family transcriptional regulator [Stellaceae bacterium]
MKRRSGVSKATPARAARAAGKAGPSRSQRGPSRTEEAVEIIRDRILDLTLTPGVRIDDKLLMRQFGLGRTPAREAFNRVATEGLIVIQRNRGAFVRPLDIQHVRQLFDAYGASERVIGYFCRTDHPGLAEDLQRIETQYEAAQSGMNFLDMTRLNSAFHRRIAEATENEYLFEHASRLYNHARRLSYFIYLTPGFALTSYEQLQDHISSDHNEIIDAVLRQDNAKLIDLLTDHALFFHQSIMEAIGGARGFTLPLGTDATGKLRRTGKRARPDSTPKDPRTRKRSSA